MYTQIFSAQANMFKALAEPKRLELINLLREQPMNVSDLCSMLGLAQANVSQHLMVLRKEGIVKTTREGKEIIYNLSHPHISKACDLMREMLIEKYQGEPMADELTLKMKDLLPLVKDPICGMRLSPKTAAYAHVLDNQTYYFCAKGCLNTFKKGNHV
jgi:ArsR family transcriptional regulator, lead/cadmium/zinc/bismuth-responsive transcriptional repressor